MVICAYTQRRWAQTCAAVESVLSQEPRPAQVILVIDHNADLAAQARRSLPGVMVLESREPPGLSGARNAGLRSVSQPVTVFLDDDAQARPGWLAALTEPYRSPDVVATGGSVYPLWPGPRPRWLPPPFDWVVGCSYLGLPEKTAVVRNPIGASMSMRTRAALDAGGFETGLGRVGTTPLGCEETELAIRLTASHPGSVVMYVPDAAVDHHVGSELAAVIPAAFFRDLRHAAAGNLDGFMRIGALLGGLAATVAGYLTGRARLAARSQARHPALPAESIQSPDPAAVARKE